MVLTAQHSSLHTMLKLRSVFDAPERERLCACLRSVADGSDDRDEHGISLSEYTFRTLDLFISAIEPDRNILAAIVVDALSARLPGLAENAAKEWGEDVAALLRGMEKVKRFSNKNSVANPDNYRGLLLSLAEDIRVIIIMIVRSLALMRLINHHPDEAWVRDVAFEANCLYAQLAHRLGLYKIKGELEDLSLKYTNRDIYTQIARKLNETKRDRDAYIADFIAPVKRKLEEAGLTFEIKGRTKSISSIWAKIQKQKVDLSGIYDLFAIRVIIDTPRANEVQACWNAYSILANMYPANPARMKDWISVPKSNGYESLHATVMGPGNKWVEVQFRTRRMDLVAEKGLAAHWRYKGGHADAADQWMNNVRDILETAESGPMELMKNVKMDVYGKEVFAFTPKGDLLRLPEGSTLLDFAFMIHSNVGCRCTGGTVNGRQEKISYKVRNGDTIDIKTSSSQTPKQDWLGMVRTTKARNKIRQSLHEARQLKADAGREMLERRAKNRKMELDEALLMKLIKQAGYKQATDFFAAIGEETLDAGKVLARYKEMSDPEREEAGKVSAEEFRIDRVQEEAAQREVLVIGDSAIKNLSYKFARCCSPIMGDEVFGFVSKDGSVKIHKKECPNARNITKRYPYRLVDVVWSGARGGVFAGTLKVIGTDDIGIVTNITSIISKDPSMYLRNIRIDSNDGLFQGYLTVSVQDVPQLNRLMKKIKGVKGVKDVVRL